MTAVRRVNASSPIRICDCGGWTDTWFAGAGCVFNVAVAPRVEVQVAVVDGAQPPLVVRGSDGAVPYVRTSPLDDGKPVGPYAPVEAALQHLNVPANLSLEITIDARVPPGASTGTSASLVVALIGAIARLRDLSLTLDAIAAAAHAVEVDHLGQQSGVQDQWCAALGGVNFIEIVRYPQATVTAVPLTAPVAWELERRLLLVYLGRSHQSSVVHEEVIARLKGGEEAESPLAALRTAAHAARAAVTAGDLAALAAAMCANTDAQSALHPQLVSEDARRLIDVARGAGAVGWKVNGAGGEGGSMTLLTGAAAASRRTIIERVQEANPAWQVIPISLSRDGLRVWESSQP